MRSPFGRSREKKVKRASSSERANDLPTNALRREGAGAGRGLSAVQGGAKQNRRWPLQEAQQGAPGDLPGLPQRLLENANNDVAVAGGRHAAHARHTRQRRPARRLCKGGAAGGGGGPGPREVRLLWGGLQPAMPMGLAPANQAVPSSAWHGRQHPTPAQHTQAFRPASPAQQPRPTCQVLFC